MESSELFDLVLQSFQKLVTQQLIVQVPSLSRCFEMYTMQQAERDLEKLEESKRKRSTKSAASPAKKAKAAGAFKSC